MTMNYRQKALASLAGIIAIFAGCLYLISIDVLNWEVIILAVFGCYPWAKYVWQVFRFEQRNTVRILQSSFPKFGFSIENTEWNDERTAVRMYGKYQGDNFMIEAAPSSAYVMIYDMPWTDVKASDPSVPRLLEAINETNAETANMSVFMMEPNEEGVRRIYTVSKTILPTYKPEQYLDSLMCEMLNSKKALHDNFQRERPWMTQHKGAVGFKVESMADDKQEESSEIAAKRESKVK